MKKGEGYIDICAGILAIALFLSAALSIFSCLSLRSDMEAAAETVLEAATRLGCISSEELSELIDRYESEKDLVVTIRASGAGDTVQLGERIWVTVEKKTTLGAAGLALPVTLRCHRSGLSEKYWKVSG